MSGSDSKVMTARMMAEDFKAIYKDVLTEKISDLNLGLILIDGNAFAIRDAQDQELFFSTSSYLDEFLAHAVPNTVYFVEDRLLIWAKEALEFARQNIRHDRFSEIFSSRLQYESVLQGLLLFDKETKLLKDYFHQIRIDSAYIDEFLPASFVGELQNAAREAIHPTLIALSSHLLAYERLGKPRRKVQGVTAVRKSPSFLNEKGTIPFSEHSGKFRIDPSGQLDRLAQYQPVINRAIKKLSEARVIQRIGNKDRLLAALLSDYEEEIGRTPTRIRIPMLWTIGIEIEERLRSQESVADEDERLDEGDIFNLQRLMLAHNLYLNCFSQTASLIKDIEASAAVYQRIGVASRKLPGQLLRIALDDGDLLEFETAATIRRSLSTEETDASENKGIIALRLGLLRGFLHSISGHLLRGIEAVASKVAVDLSAQSIVSLLRADISFSGVIAFMDHQAHLLSELSSQAPVYFGYIRGVFALLGINV